MCELLWIFVLAVPDGEALMVKVLPEVGNGYGHGILVGILPLELIHDKRTRRERGSGHTSIVFNVFGIMQQKTNHLKLKF